MKNFPALHEGVSGAEFVVAHFWETRVATADVTDDGLVRLSFQIKMVPAIAGAPHPQRLKLQLVGKTPEKSWRRSGFPINRNGSLHTGEQTTNNPEKFQGRISTSWNDLRTLR